MPRYNGVRTRKRVPPHKRKMCETTNVCPNELPVHQTTPLLSNQDMSSPKKRMNPIQPKDLKLIGRRFIHISSLTKLVNIAMEHGSRCSEGTVGFDNEEFHGLWKFHGNADYGRKCADTDLDTNIVNQRIQDLIDQLQVGECKQKHIERQSIGQTANHLWFHYRQRRITASMAGRIYSLQDKTNNTSVILSIVKPDPRLQLLDSLKHGNCTEGQAKRKYTEETGNVVTECGLFVSLENGILAASPDGLVGEDGIVEIKCPIAMIGHDPKTLPDVMSSPYLHFNEHEKLALKKSHAYYRQVIMQLYVTNRLWCDFVVYSFRIENGEQIPFKPFIERIEKIVETDKLWKTMYTKFIKFYREDLGPELVDSRSNRSMPIRQPKYRQEAIDRVLKRDIT